MPSFCAKRQHPNCPLYIHPEENTDVQTQQSPHGCCSTWPLTPQKTQRTEPLHWNDTSRPQGSRAIFLPHRIRCQRSPNTTRARAGDKAPLGLPVLSCSHDKVTTQKNERGCWRGHARFPGSTLLDQACFHQRFPRKATAVQKQQVHNLRINGGLPTAQICLPKTQRGASLFPPNYVNGNFALVTSAPGGTDSDRYSALLCRFVSIPLTAWSTWCFIYIQVPSSCLAHWWPISLMPSQSHLFPSISLKGLWRGRRGLAKTSPSASKVCQSPPRKGTGWGRRCCRALARFGPPSRSPGWW